MKKESCNYKAISEYRVYLKGDQIAEVSAITAESDIGNRIIAIGTELFAGEDDNERNRIVQSRTGSTVSTREASSPYSL